MLEQGGTGWEKIQSIFSAVRASGRHRPDRLCRARRADARAGGQSGWLWRSDAAFALKAAALATRSLLATPYVLDYDLMVLAVAIAFFAATDLRAAFATRDQPACSGLDRAAVGAQHRRAYRHSARR